MEITAQTAPEVAIKHAYDLGRAVRNHGALETQLAENAELWIESRYRTHPLVRYLRVGFKAGYLYARVPGLDDAAVTAADSDPEKKLAGGDPTPQRPPLRGA